MFAKGDRIYHDDVIKWKFPRYWPFVRGIHRSPVNPPHKGQWSGALMFTLICARINGWVNNREAGDLRRYLTHYDVIVMCCVYLLQMLAVFVVVYILQYTALVISNIWQLSAMPPLWVILAAVVTSNFGGVFNFAAYTLMRRWSRRTENSNSEPNGASSAVVHAEEARATWIVNQHNILLSVSPSNKGHFKLFSFSFLNANPRWCHAFMAILI